MSENNKWSEINDEAKRIVSQIKNKGDTENKIQDLKDSLKDSVNSMEVFLKELVEIVNSSVTDEQLKEDSKKLVNSIAEELNMTINNIKAKIPSINQESEEE